MRGTHLFAAAVWAVWLTVATAAQPPSPAPTTADPRPAPAAQQPAPGGAGDLMPAEAPASTGQELDRVTLVRDDPASFWERPLVNLNHSAVEFEKQTGLKIGAALTMLFQHATTGDHRNAAGGDIDLMMRWTAVGRGTKNTGVLVFNSEYRWQMADTVPSALSGQIGAGTATTNSFSEREPVIKELYWVQDLLEGRLRIGVGRADPENLTTAHKMQSANTFFQHKAFSGNPAVAFPGSGPTLAAAWRTDDWFIGGGFINAYSTTTTVQIDSLLDEFDLFSFAEAGWTPKFEGLGAGRYRIAYWHLDAKNRGSVVAPSDWGINFIVDQELGEDLSGFFRYGYSEADVTNIRHLVEGGVGYKGLSKDGFTGLAIAHIDYAGAGQSSETVVELFHRWQVTPQVQFTLGAEAIMNPANNPDTDTVGVFNVRLRMTF